MVDEKKDCLINKRSGCPEQLSAKNLCLENAKTRNQLGAPKGVDENPPERFPYLVAFAENLIQYFYKFTLNGANSYIKINDELETQLKVMDLLGENELKSYELSHCSETNSDILPNAMSEMENDVQMYAQNTGNIGFNFNIERKEEPFIDVCPEEYAEALERETPVVRLKTFCDRLQMKGRFETKFLHFLKPLQEQQVKQVLEEMLRDKNFMEVLLLLISSCEFDALMDYLNERIVPSTYRRCLGGDTNGSLGGIPHFLITLYQELLRGKPNIVFETKPVMPLLLKDFMVIEEIRDIININSIHILTNVKETLKTGNPKGMEDKEGLTSIASKGKNELLAMVLTVLEQIEIREAMQRMTPCTQEEASPPTASSDLSSLSQSDSLSSLEWEDPPTDVLRQLLDIAMGREPLPPDASSSFIIQVPIKDLMAKSEEEPESDLSQSVTLCVNGSETKENNGTDTLPPAKEDKKYQPFEKNINLELLVKNQLARKQFL